MADDFNPTVSYEFTVAGTGFPASIDWLVFGRSDHSAAFLKAHSGQALGKISVAIDFGNCKSNSEIAEIY